MRDVATPVTWERYTGNWQGSMEGWLMTRKTFPPFRMSKTLPGLKSFYMAGQWVEPGGGVPTAAMSGRNVIQIICKAGPQALRDQDSLRESSTAGGKGDILLFRPNATCPGKGTEKVECPLFFTSWAQGQDDETEDDQANRGVGLEREDFAEQENAEGVDDHDRGRPEEGHRLAELQGREDVEAGRTSRFGESRSTAGTSRSGRSRGRRAGGAGSPGRAGRPS